MTDKENTFIKMFNEGWCSTCDFDASKCAEQQECESCKQKEEKDEKTI